MPEEPLLSLREVSRSFPLEGASRTIEVLRDISLDIHAGQTLAIMGPSGSGKSTLLNLMGALDQPSSGSIILNGRDLTTLTGKDLDSIRNSRFGFVFQSHYLLPQCTVIENVLIPTLADGRRASTPEDEKRAVDLLERVGLQDRIQSFPGMLSGGERQRVAVVRALINQPALLLADEPTGSLDQHTAGQLAELLAGLNRDLKVTQVVVTHSQELAACMGLVYELREGRLAGSDPKAH